MAVIKLRTKPVYTPHTLFEEIADLHGAVDPDTGHLICHYYPLAPVIVEVDGEAVPGLQVGECLTLVPGQDNVEKIVSATVRAEGIAPEGYDTRAIGLALAPLRVQAYQVDVRAPRDGEEPLAIIYRPGKPGEGDQYAILVWKCRKDDKRSPVLQV